MGIELTVLTVIRRDLSMHFLKPARGSPQLEKRDPLERKDAIKSTRAADILGHIVVYGALVYGQT